jgi:hypothetical protein
MKEKKPKKNSSEIKYKISIPNILRTYITMIALTHKNVGVLRMIAAYYFILFAFVSLWFTIVVPMTSEFKIPTDSEKIVSRLISSGMTIANFIAYGITLSWKNKNAAPLPIRIALIAFVFYIDVFLISRIIYVLVREGSL